MIYFVTDGEYLKIGYTDNDVSRRIASLQSGNARKLELVGTIEGSKEAEHVLHCVFREFRVSGEWFLYNIDKIAESANQSAINYNYSDLEDDDDIPGSWKEWAEVDVSDFSNTRRRVVSLIRKFPRMSNSELARQSGTSRPTVIITKQALKSRFVQTIGAQNKDDYVRDMQDDV